jgi:manganese/zinc/iron transport system permease protein
MLTMHIAHHTATYEAEQENQVMHLHEHLKWSPRFAMEIVSLAQREGLVAQRDGLLTLTERGLKRSQQEFSA